MSDTVEGSVVITHDVGLHARPSVKLTKLAKGFAAVAGIPMVKGFAVGRTIFSNAARQWLRGEMDDAQAVADMAARFQRLADIWNGARRKAG